MSSGVKGGLIKATYEIRKTEFAFGKSQKLNLVLFLSKTGFNWLILMRDTCTAYLWYI